MATLVFFHAHPDDEAIATAGTMLAARRDGHRVVLVMATRGELGERPDGYSGDLGALRTDETIASAGMLGVERLVFLGFRDSGMEGDPANDDTTAFWRADLDEAGRRLASVIEQEQADALVVYDEYGAYGHPDHVQVHRVGHRAAGMTAVPRLFEVTFNRDLFRDLFGAEAADTGEGESAGGIGMPDALITTAIDVRRDLDRKREAMAAHASQIGSHSWFLTLGPEAFAEAFGTEWYIRIQPRFDGDPVTGRESGLV